MTEVDYNDARKEASKRLRALYNAVPPATRDKFKPFRFQIVGGAKNVSPHIFYGETLERASEYARIWSEARGLILKSEEAAP